jgi:arylsulfatase A-like enzyme
MKGHRVAAVLALLPLVACGKAPQSSLGVHRLVDEMKPEMVSASPAAPKPAEPAGFWDFKERTSQPTAKESQETLGWKAGVNVTGLAEHNGRLTGRTTSGFPIIYVDRKPAADESDLPHSIEIHMRADKGANLSVSTQENEKLNFKDIVALGSVFPWFATTPIVPGDDFQTYTVPVPTPVRLSAMRYLLVRPTDADQAGFEIESIRLVSRKEFLDRIPSGVGWQGLSDIYRETVVARAPESIGWELQLPENPMLDLYVGTIEYGPVTFRLALSPPSNAAKEEVLAEHTVTTPHRWEPLSLNLSSHARQRVRLSLSLAAEATGALGFWGGPAVRDLVRAPVAAKRQKPAIELAPGDPPQGVILIIADTLRRDHLNLYGYGRETAPVLARMASQGTLFTDNTSQATWTKVSMPSIMTSLYPTSDRVLDFTDRLSAEATTLAEVFRDTGYATVSYSSVLFSGRFTNLHQGFEELHESGSVRDPGSSKTARQYVDRLSEWLKDHREVPFFAFLHVFDPHDPYEPYRPYNSMWADPTRKEEHEKNLEKVRKVIADPLMKRFGMPSRDELVTAGIDPKEYISRDMDWYDGSIRGLDVEIGRLQERLRGLGLADKTLMVFASDHGEEFLEHGRMFHRQTVYGELTSVPLVFYRPGQVPSGAVIDETVENIDIMPTILELSHLPVPKGVEGKSLLPLLAAARDRAKGAGASTSLSELAGKYGWSRRGAVSEKASTTQGGGPPPRSNESYSIIFEGWRLINNKQRPPGTPEFELYEHTRDPLNLKNVATLHPDTVKQLTEKLEAWRREALAGQLPKAASTKKMSKEELERLRSLGYIQ